MSLVYGCTFDPAEMTLETNLGRPRAEIGLYSSLASSQDYADLRISACAFLYLCFYVRSSVFWADVSMLKRTFMRSHAFYRAGFSPRQLHGHEQYVINCSSLAHETSFLEDGLQMRGHHGLQRCCSCCIQNTRRAQCSATMCRCHIVESIIAY
jgi:hypothetical protein